ncbi:MAG: RNA polymerase sigma factor [Candidatus Acidiferrales bacterium]
MTTDFNSLYQKYALDVLRFALYLSGNRAEAEDITSETFVRAWTSPEPILAATVKGYLFTIARNLFLQGLRKKKRDVELDVEMRDPQAGPHQLVEEKAEFAAVLAGLQKLPEIDRSVVVMRAFEGMSYEEISQALGIPLGTVKVKIHRARLALSGIRG